jgi:hypothetical protein
MREKPEGGSTFSFSIMKRKAKRTFDDTYSAVEALVGNDGELNIGERRRKAAPARRVRERLASPPVVS